MRKKILGVVGSPRLDGNTHILVSKILEGAESEAAVTDIVFLKDLKIKECDGCHVCWNGKPCSKNDDMIDLYSKIGDCDAIVFGTPVYWYGPTALMKGFIDRFVFFNCPENRKMIANKDAVLAIPYEEESLQTASPLIEFFEKSLSYLQMNLVGKIIVPGVTLKGEVKKKTGQMSLCFELGKRLAKGS